ncbi:MAG: tripeptide aminopeptidase PepT, partial [Treponema sp.]|nr:tripeptide aminopeptidase PepT [Treponema sp.]
MKYISSSSEFGQKLLNRFIKYVKIWTESDSSIADAGTIPSTNRQFDFANLLKEELISLGLTNVQVTKNCYVYAFLPSTKPENTTSSICLLAHMDTSEEVSGKDVNPLLHKNYDGKILQLNSDISINPQNDTYLAKTANTSDTIITSDGSTLLGADNKAGIAEIVTSLEYLCNHKEIQHCAIEVVFSPDEETGHGMDKVPMDLIKSKVAYTVDGGDLGQLETECFNAASATVTFTGKATHPGSAKESGMINAILAAASFLESLPKNELPETTEHYQGFYAPMDISS